MEDIKGTFTGSLKFGDEVSEEIYDYLLGCDPPVVGDNPENIIKNCDSMSFCLKEQLDLDVKIEAIMQNGEPYDHGPRGATYMSIGITAAPYRYFWLGTLPNKYNIEY